MVKLARENEKIVAITASMKDGTGLREFQKEFPKRFFDVGIAEQHAITMSAGMAKEGRKEPMMRFLQEAISYGAGI